MAGKRPRAEKCLPAMNIAFAKVHKAGSSTIANILQRFGYTRNLNFMLPNKGFHSAGYNYIRSKNRRHSKNEILPLLPNTTYNILWNHAIYDSKFFHSLLPNDTAFIGILRKPISQFVSAYRYFRSLDSSINREKTSETPAEYLKTVQWKEKQLYDSYLVNRQSVDLGMDINKIEDDGYLDKYIQQLDNDFQLMMIMENFDESLVLLKRMLCWSMKDILYTKKNASHRKKHFSFTKEDLERHSKINKADMKLYKHFSEKLLKQIQKEGNDFQMEVAAFKKLRNITSIFCKKMEKSNDTFSIEATNWSEQFILNRDDCKYIGLHELKFFDILLKRHVQSISAMYPEFRTYFEPHEKKKK